MTVQTKNSIYTLVDQGDGGFSVTGGRYFPRPMLCTVVDEIVVGRGMQLEPRDPDWRKIHRQYVFTSRVVAITET